MEAIKEQFKNLGTLGRDELFFLKLSDIPLYELKIEAMLKREKYAVQTDTLLLTLSNILKGCHFILRNINLNSFLSIVLFVAQNIVPDSHRVKNQVYSLEDIPYLLDSKPPDSDAPTFLHAVVDVAEENYRHLMDFTKKANILHNLSRFYFVEIEDKIKILWINLMDLTMQLTNGSKEDMWVYLHFHEFVEFALHNAYEIKKQLEIVKSASKSVAEQFSIDPDLFELNKCFKIFANYFDKLNRISLENRQRRMKNKILTNICSLETLPPPKRSIKKISSGKKKSNSEQEKQPDLKENRPKKF